MAQTYKFVLTTWKDSTNPSDGLQITPTFHHKLVSPDLTDMANDLLDGWEAWGGTQVNTTQCRVTIYKLPGAPPNYPVETVTRRPDVSTASSTNRDLAVCLSAYSDFNRPRYRGRLYIPVCLQNNAATGGDVSSAIQSKVAALVPLFEGLGGADWDWGVYSRVDAQFRKYTNWFIDNSWDTQRRRGKRATGRTTGTTSG